MKLSDLLPELLDSTTHLSWPMVSSSNISVQRNWYYSATFPVRPNRISSVSLSNISCSISSSSSNDGVNKISLPLSIRRYRSLSDCFLNSANKCTISTELEKKQFPNSHCFRYSVSIVQVWSFRRGDDTCTCWIHPHGDHEVVLVSEIRLIWENIATSNALRESYFGSAPSTVDHILTRRAFNASNISDSVDCRTSEDKFHLLGSCQLPHSLLQILNINIRLADQRSYDNIRSRR